jgi:ribonuclease R
VSEEELASRRDLRALHFVTIDPKTARDFDDAIAIEPDAGGGIRVWVAVADVSAYVEEGSPIDREARRRGCSLYLPDRAIPMLPPALSSGICSLRPGEDRLAVAVRLDLGPAGEPRGEEIVAAVIHSRGQLDYGSVAAVLEGRMRGKLEAYREHLLELEELARVAALLRQRRLARGSLDLDLPEAEVVLDEDDPERVRTISESRADAPLRRAYNLVEELMLAANEAVGRFFERAGAPTIWRVHAPPTRDALDRLAGRLGAYGVSASADALRMERVMARLLRELATHRAARPLSYLVLRALKQAVYSVSNLGHYGLASTAYLHFTSPIRRYPDLHVHRLVKELLRERGAPAGRPLRPTSQGGATALSAIARESTAAERQAIEVEREVQSLYAAQLMRDQIGLEAWGTVSGVTGFGFFVTLDEPYVDGLCRLERLGGWYELAEEEPRLYLREERAGAARPAILRVISLGDRIKVRVVEASIARRQIDLVPVAEPGSHLPDPSLPEKRRDPRGRREDRRGGRPATAKRGRPGAGRGGDRRGRGKGRSR